MSLRKISTGAVLFSAVLFCFAPLLSAEAQDVDVPGNLTMHDSADPTVGNVLKEGVPFLHNFGTNNTFLGVNAGNLTVGGGFGNNTAIGFSALRSNTSGSYNTATGQNALMNNTDGVFNTASGASALSSNTTGGANTASGRSALAGNTTGSFNTATGSQALSSNTTGEGNTATGFAALFNNTIGTYNTASGHQALWSNTTGHDNTASGNYALNENTTGNGNTAIGVEALAGNHSGNDNTAIGPYAMSIVRGATGSGNTAIGSDALVGNGTGDNNTAIGREALASNFSGSNNTAIGYRSDVSELVANATAIGYGAIVDGSNKIRLGNSDVTVIEGQVPYTYTSDRNQKENFRAVDADEVLNRLRGLSVTSWNYKGQDAKQFRHYGPVAQDFFATFGHDAVGAIGTPTTITSGDLDGILMIAAQALEKRTATQEERFTSKMNALRTENADLKKRLEELERKVDTQGSYR